MEIAAMPLICNVDHHQHHHYYHPPRRSHYFTTIWGALTAEKFPSLGNSSVGKKATFAISSSRHHLFSANPPKHGRDFIRHH